MPMSSTVWCASISRSPFARTVRSSPPWRASWSSMWSRNGMPDSRLASPLPSRSTATKTWVSLVSRWTSALRMFGGEGRGERLDQFRVLVGGADREPQAVGEQWMRAVKVADQYTTRHQRLEYALGIGDAHQQEVRGRGKSPHARHRVQRAFQPGALRDDRARLLLEDFAMPKQHLARGRREHVHVVGRPKFLHLADPFPRTHGEAEPKPRETQLGNRAQEHQVRKAADGVQHRRPARERVIRLIDDDEPGGGLDDAL